MKTKPKGVLGSLLANVDEQSLAKTRNRMLLAMKIEAVMHEERLTQKQLAKKMGKTESEISDWLSGNRNFTSDTLMDIELALNINLLNTTICNSVVIPEVEVPYKSLSKKTVGLKTENSHWCQLRNISDCEQNVKSDLLVG